MTIQTRAAATRQCIISAAVDLFCDRGYAETSLTDITGRAQVTTGAFYYHFDSKEDLAKNLINEGWPKALAVIDQCLAAPAPGLENIIVMTYAVSALLKSDRSVWISNHLNQAFGQLSEEGRRGFEHRATVFADRMAATLLPNDLLPDVTPQQVGSMVWITLHGCHLLSDAMTDSVSDRLSESWPILLRGMVTAESLPYFQQFVNRTAVRYQTQSTTAS